MNFSYAQNAVSNKVNLQTAVTNSLSANPNTRVGNLGVEYQQTLKGSTGDIGKTNINLTYGQYNSPIPYDNNITITQNIPNPVYLKRLKELADASIEASRSQLKIYQSQIAFQVKNVYYQLLYRNEQRKLADTLIALYKRVLRAADVRFNTGETNILEKYNANTQLQEAIAQQQQVEEYINSNLKLLGKYMNDTTISGIADSVLKEKTISLSLDSSILGNNPQLQSLRSQIAVASKEIRVEKARLLPDFSLGYFNQSLVGNHSKDGVEKYYGVGKRFQGVEIGISIPIFAKPQKAKIHAAEINMQIREAEVEAFYFSLSQRGTVLLSDLRRLQIQIGYFRKTALPQAELLINKSQRAFEAGEIDYYQLSQSLNNANNVRRQYIEVINQYNLTAIELELISGL
jgi:cobalt-zinc-cadmium resistance protein CzcA